MATEYIPVFVPGETRVERVPYAKTVTITEHKAPTDESIKLYNELLEKAEKSLLEVMTIKSSVLGEVKIAIYRRVDNFLVPMVARFRFVLNGETFDGEIHIETETYGRVDFNEIVSMEVFKKYTEVIAEKLFHAHINSAIVDRRLIER